MTMPPSTLPTVDLDIALVTVSGAGRRHRRARLAIKDGHAKIITLGQGVPSVVKEADVLAVEGGGSVYSITTSTGETWTAVKTGCGCGGQNRIKDQLNNFDAWGDG